MSSTRMLKGSCLCECDEVISVHPEVFFCHFYFFAFLFLFCKMVVANLCSSTLHFRVRSEGGNAYCGVDRLWVYD
jgi:hypothetical protein